MAPRHSREVQYAGGCGDRAAEFDGDGGAARGPSGPCVSTRKPVTSSTGTETTEGGSPEGREYREHAALAAAAMADAKAEEEAEKKPGAKQRRLSQAFEGAVEGTYQTLVGRKEEASSSAGGKPAELPQRSLSATAQEIIRSVRGTQAAAAADDTQSSPANTDAAAAQRAKPADEPPPQRSLSARVLESARGSL